MFITRKPFSVSPLELRYLETPSTPMSVMVWSHLLAFVVAGLGAFSSVPIVQDIALRYRLFDLPSIRKVHQHPMVRLGGVAICAGTIASLLLVFLLGGFHPFFGTIPAKMAWVIVGSFCFFLLGVTDDLMGLSPLSRLVMQGMIASYIWMQGIKIDFFSIPGFGMVYLEWLSWPVTVLWLVGVVNAINWIDGLDGLASGVSCIGAISISIICFYTGQPVVAMFMLALAGSLLGFLYYNFNPAQIFMGDGGSYFIGFTIAGASIVGMFKGAAITAIALPIILAVPLGDMIAVIIARLRQGHSPFKADRRHLHHRLLEIGLSHRFTVLLIYALTLWAGSWAIALVGIPNAMTLVAGSTGILAAASWQAWRLVRQQ